MRGAGPVEMCPRLASQVEEMLEAGRRDERGSRTLALEQRVRRDGRPVREPLEIADTEPARERGLMFRRRLAPRAGMVFVFPQDARSAFWMKNTLIPLSIAFYDRRGRIVRILDMAPCRADPCPIYDPKATYRYALEVNRGALRRWHVRVGDRITLRRAR